MLAGVTRGTSVSLGKIHLLILNDAKNLSVFRTFLLLQSLIPDSFHHFFFLPLTSFCTRLKKNTKVVEKCVDQSQQTASF